MKSFFISVFALFLLAACSGGSSVGSMNEGADSASVDGEMSQDADDVKPHQPRVTKVERSENSVPYEDATEEDEEMKTAVTVYSYDSEGRVASISYKGEDEAYNVTFDYSTPGKVLRVIKYDGGSEDYVVTYFIDDDGFVTKVQDETTTVTYKYKDGCVTDVVKGNKEGSVKLTWKDGNIVTSTKTYSDGFKEVTSLTYTDIPLEANFDYALCYTSFEDPYVHLISKGFNCKNYIATESNDHPIEDEYTYEKDKDGQIKQVTYNCARDNYCNNGIVKVVIDR